MRCDFTRYPTRFVVLPEKLNAMSKPSWHPTASVEMLKKRADLVWTIRTFFHAQGFVEIQTPVLSRDTVIDRFIDPVEVTGEALGVSEFRSERFFLQTSPEFALKRLLAAGMDKVYSISPVFRAAERGEFHNLEFTMVEWYRVGDAMQEGVALLAELVKATLAVPAVHVDSYQSVFSRLVGCDPLSASVDELASVAQRLGLSIESDFSEDRDDWLNLLFAESVQPSLGIDLPQVVTHYPASQSALAKISSADRRTADRFELFIRGIELANGYDELTNAAELRERNRQVAEQREGDGSSTLPQRSRLLEAMDAGLPASSGCALGLERLIMVATQSASIDRVMPFPLEIA